MRINVHAGVVATDQGLIEGHAAETLRPRPALATDGRRLAFLERGFDRGARIRVVADPVFASDIAQAARDLADRAGADALVVSGAATGDPTDLDDLKRVREAVPDAVLFAGSGVTETSVADALRYADPGHRGYRGQGGRAPVDPARLERFVARV